MQNVDISLNSSRISQSLMNTPQISVRTTTLATPTLTQESNFSLVKNVSNNLLWLTNSISNNNKNNSSSSYLSKNDDLRNVYLGIESKLAILPIFLMVAGTFGNCLAFYVLTRKKLRHQSTMLYFATLTLMDTVSLYQWNFNFFYKYKVNQHNQNLEEQSLFLCRYVSFMAYFSMQTSAWILTAISIDRYLIVTNLNWKQKYSRSIKFNLIVIGCILAAFAFINLPVTIFNGRQILNRIKKIECYTTSYLEFWQKFSLLLECLFPLTLMIIFNGLLIKRTYKSSTRLRKGKDHKGGPTVSSNAKKKSHSSFSLTKDDGISDCGYGGGLTSTNKSNQLNASSYENSSFIINDSKFKNPANRSDLFTNASSTNNFSAQENTNNNATNIKKVQNSSKVPQLKKGGGRPKLIVPLRLLRKKESTSSSKQLRGDSSLVEQDQERDSKLETYLRARSQHENENERFETMVNSISCSFSNLEFLGRKLTEKRASLVVNSSQIVVATPTPLAVLQTAGISYPLDRTKSAPMQLSAGLESGLHYRPSFSERISLWGNGLTNASANSRSPAGEVRRRISYNRNRRIVLMLSLLTLSFAVSTLPSAIFYTFFRTSLNDKPYRRLLSLCFNLLRHLSHAFNFIIYFTSSTVIKQQLAEILNSLHLKNLYFNYVTCCGCFKSRAEYLEAKKRLKKKKATNNKVEAKKKGKSVLNKKGDKKVTTGEDLNASGANLEYEMNFVRKSEHMRRLLAYSAAQISEDKPTVLREISLISIDASSLTSTIHRPSNREEPVGLGDLIKDDDDYPVRTVGADETSNDVSVAVVGNVDAAKNSSTKTISFNVPKLKLNSKSLPKRSKPSNWL